MKVLISALALTFSFSSFSATDVCSVSYNPQGSTLNWTAFKTPKKVGVKGQFTNLVINSSKSSTVDELLSKATFEVETNSVSTNDKGRDAKIFQFFFKKMSKGTKITGKVVKVNPTNVDVEFSLNGATKVITLTKKYDENQNTVTLNGEMNVLDFGMKDNLASLTKACETLHEGVTWPDVTVELVASVPKSCK